MGTLLSAVSHRAAGPHVGQDEEREQERGRAVPPLPIELQRAIFSHLRKNDHFQLMATCKGLLRDVGSGVSDLVLYHDESRGPYEAAAVGWRLERLSGLTTVKIEAVGCIQPFLQAVVSGQCSDRISRLVLPRDDASLLASARTLTPLPMRLPSLCAIHVDGRPHTLGQEASEALAAMVEARYAHGCLPLELFSITFLRVEHQLRVLPLCLPTLNRVLASDAEVTAFLGQWVSENAGNLKLVGIGSPLGDTPPTAEGMAGLMRGLAAGHLPQVELLLLLSLIHI